MLTVKCCYACIRINKLNKLFHDFAISQSHCPKVLERPFKTVSLGLPQRASGKSSKVIPNSAGNNFAF